MRYADALCRHGRGENSLSAYIENVNVVAILNGTQLYRAVTVCHANVPPVCDVVNPGFSGIDNGTNGITKCSYA